MAVVTIFGDSHSEPGSSEYENAVRLGKLLAESGLDIATGGYGGIMDASLKGAAEHNVERIGIISNSLESRSPNPYITKLLRTDTYLERLQELINIGDAYIIFPGGTGTLLELAAVWALKEREIIRDKPIICIGKQWRELLQIMKSYSQQTLDSSDIIQHAESPEEAAAIIIRNLK